MPHTKAFVPCGGGSYLILVTCIENLPLSRFFTKLSKNNMGASWGASDVPHDGGASQGATDTPWYPPCYFFLRTKIISPIKCIVFFPKITWWVSAPHDAPHNGGHQGLSDTIHPLSTTHNIPHQHTTHPTTRHPPMEKMWGLNAWYFISSST